MRLACWWTVRARTSTVCAALSHRGWRLYTHGLMWSIGKTDGLISQNQLPMLLPHDSPANRLSAAAELVQRGLWQWVDEPAGWLYPDWTDHQSTLAQIEHDREIERRKKANWRASTRESTGQRRESTGEYGYGYGYGFFSEATTAKL